MYRAHELWEDGLRVAKDNGNQKELGEISIKIAEIWMVKNEHNSWLKMD